MSHAPPFSDILVPSFEPVDATPERPIEPSFRGIRLAAPPRIDLGGGPTDPDEAAVPLVGLITVLPECPGAEDPLADLTILATDTGGRVWFGRIDGIASDPADRALPEEGVTWYFNVDLVDVLGLHDRPATYWVYAFLGDLVSNVVRIEVANGGAS